jgi:septal ring factor EnvC (AmiA/AmiB activator)
MAANTSITDLTGANKKFADDAVRMANTGQQLKDVQSQLEESRKTSSTLTEQLEQAKTSNSTMVEQMTTRRRQDLVSRYGLSEERVANLDDAKLAVLEDELPHVTPAPANSASLPANGTGLGLGGGGGSPDLSTLSESDRALRTIERLKDKN